MKITRSTLSIEIKGRAVTAGGEAYLPGHGSPDFVVYSDTIKNWNDGEPIDNITRERIINCIVKEAQTLGIVVEIE